MPTSHHHVPPSDCSEPASLRCSQSLTFKRGKGVGSRLPRAGFTLVVTLVILAAVTILVVGLYGIVSRESQTSASYDAVDQADLAMQSGLEHVGALLKGSLADELGVVFSVPLTPAVDEKQRPREMLVAANYDVSSKLWKYQPLASGVARPVDGDKLKMPPVQFEKLPAKDPMVGPSVEVNELEARRLPSPEPWMARVPRYWMQMTLPSEEKSSEGEEGEQEEDPNAEKLVARYSFYVEDLQSKLSLANSGIHDSDRDLPHFQPDLVDTMTPLIPNLPGMKIDPGGRWRRQPASVWTLLRPDLEPINAEALPKTVNAMHRRLTAINSKRLAFSPEMWRELLITPDPLTNWPGLEITRLNGPEARLANGSLVDPQLRALEENTTGYLKPYDELALVPHGPGFANGGEMKKNLNEYLIEIGANTSQTDHQKMTDAVDEIAEHIDRHLPDFSKRAGGYPLPRSQAITQRDKHRMAYLKNLAAGMLDYADKDSYPSINVAKGGAGNENDEANIEYRGMDSFPLVNEYWQRHRFETFLGREVEVSLTDYVELWNPTNHAIKGRITCCFEYKGEFSVNSRTYPVMSSMANVVRGRPPSTTPGLSGMWFGEKTIDLQPNEIIVLAFDPVVFKLDGGALGNVAGVRYKGDNVTDGFNDERTSRYRLAFCPEGSADFTVVDLPFAPLERYEMTTSLSNRQRFNVNQPGLAYRVRDKNWAFNVGDTRAAYYIDYHQEVIDYDDGSSPWGRNFRRFDNLAGEARTYLWPDGGHNSLPCPTRIGSILRNPDDITMRNEVNANNNVAERQKFVQRISNVGRFYSMSELGHIFDPIMWSPRNKIWSNADMPPSDLLRYDEHADLNPEILSTDPQSDELDAHKRFCGGNSLRIGRVEHSLFRPDYRDKPDKGRPLNRGMAATSLLDLFHCGDPNALETDTQRYTGPLTRIDGHVNVNTASRETLRAVVAGRLAADPLLKKDSMDPDPDSKKPTVLLAPSKSRTEAQADIIATAIIENRPYITPAEVAEKAILSAKDEENLKKDDELPLLKANWPVFGYTKRDPNDDRRVIPEWSDAAAEELFSRLYNNSTVRSRHFQVVVTGQTVKIGREGGTKVVATRSRLFHLFVRPVRNADGTLQKQEVEITYSRPL